MKMIDSRGASLPLRRLFAEVLRVPERPHGTRSAFEAGLRAYSPKALRVGQLSFPNFRRFDRVSMIALAT